MSLRSRSGWRGAGLAALTVAAYLPVFRAGLVWDDDTALTHNPVVLARDGLRKAWFSTQATDYWPVTYSSFWVEWRMWGARALGYHAVNLALHIAVCLLLWAVLRQLRVPGAWLAAALFAVHPINVESVAWIAERKNVLAGAFYLGSILIYLRGRYWLSLGLFLFGLLSKGSIAPLPLVLAGILLAEERTERRDWLRLIPFFAIACVLVGVNVWFQTHGSRVVIRSAGPLERVLGAADVVWFYLGKALWPAHLSFVYSAWHLDSARGAQWVPLAALLLAGAGAALAWRRWRTPWVWAWFYFIALLIPVMGLVDVYFMRYALVADHYAYLALMGVCAAAGAALARFRLRWAAALVLAVFAALTYRQSLAYRDAPTLYRAVLARNPNSWLAHNNLGVLLLADPGKLPEAEAHFRAALALDPDSPEPRDNLGDTLGREGKSAEAIPYFQESIRRDPTDAAARNNLGKVYAQEGRAADAAAEFESAYRLQPGQPEFRSNASLSYLRLADAALSARRFDTAEAAYTRALEIDPNWPEAHNNLGNLFLEAGKIRDAITEYETALRLDPTNARVQRNLELARKAR